MYLQIVGNVDLGQIKTGALKAGDIRQSSSLNIAIIKTAEKMYW